MIVLDTNVVLETRREHMSDRVLDWLDRQPVHELWLTAITAAELQAGVEKYLEGDERARRQAEVSSILNEDFSDRVLPFDLQAALAYARIAGPLIRSERAVRRMDLQIAAIARANGAALATRNIRDFLGLGVDLIDPWTV